MPLHSSAGPFYPLVGIAVNTTVDAAMIRTDIHAFHAAAEGALIGILFCTDRAAKNPTDLLWIDTGRMGNPILGQVYRLRAGGKRQIVSHRSAGKAMRNISHCGLLYLAKTALILCIAVKKAENTAACIGMQKRAQAFKLLPVPV